MVKVPDTIVLTHDIIVHNLEQGDVGAVVHYYPEDGFEVEFVNGEGTTAPVLTLSAMISAQWAKARFCTPATTPIRDH